MVTPSYCDVFYECELPMAQPCTIFVLICINQFLLFVQIDFTLSSYDYYVQSNHILNLPKPFFVRTKEYVLGLHSLMK